jgi:hypothetical protein
MLALTEELVEIVRTYAAPIAPSMRPRFYEMVDRKLRECELGAGIVARVCAEVPKEFIIAPAVDEQPMMPSSQPPRSPWRRRA